MLTPQAAPHWLPTTILPSDRVTLSDTWVVWSPTFMAWMPVVSAAFW
jgi:hypothetical protein